MPSSNVTKSFSAFQCSWHFTFPLPPKLGNSNELNASLNFFLFSINTAASMSSSHGIGQPEMIAPANPPENSVHLISIDLQTRTWSLASMRLWPQMGWLSMEFGALNTWWSRGKFRSAAGLQDKMTSSRVELQKLVLVVWRGRSWVTCWWVHCLLCFFCCRVWCSLSRSLGHRWCPFPSTLPSPGGRNRNYRWRQREQKNESSADLISA